MTNTSVIMPSADPFQDIIDEFGTSSEPTTDTTADTNTIERLLARAERHGDKRAKTVAVRIRHDIDLLDQLLAKSGEEAAARRKVERYRAKLAAAEAELQAKTSAPARNIARLAGVNSPAPSADTPTMRAWLIEHGFPVADRGRLTRGDIEAYVAAHEGGE